MNALNGSSMTTASSPLNSNDGTASEVVEVAFLLSRIQINQLAHQGHRRGMTSAQFLRQFISSMCQSGGESV